MAGTHISITDALSDAWRRMQTILFRPFSLEKWLVLGFTAWLAGLGQGGQSFGWNLGGGADANERERWASGAASLAEGDAPGSEFLQANWASDSRLDWGDRGRWLLEHPLWVALGAFGCLVLVVLFVVILWLSSRGKFMFLDNVVHDRAEVVEPWRRFRRLANSHFFFQLAFFGLFLAAVLATALLVYTMISVAGPAWLVVVPGAVLGVLGVLIIAYIQYFLDGFVVPLMHRHDLAVLDAWRHFGGLLRRHPGVFLVSGPFLLVLGLAALLAVVMAGLLTCCIGLLLVIIPYVGTVILLPIPVTYRGFTVALLDRMEPGYFPDTAVEPASTGSTT